MERNTQLLFDVADKIEEDEQQYDQATWFQCKQSKVQVDCDTRACIAGWGYLLSTPLEEIEAARLPDILRSRVQRESPGLFGITLEEACVLFNQSWRPHDGLSVPDALRKVAEGAEIADVTHPDFLDSMS